MIFNLKKNKYVVCIPVYNEIQNLNTLTNNLKEFISKYNDINLEVFFCDDCSTDGSYNYLKNICKQNEQFKVIRFSDTNFGPGYIFKEFFIYINQQTFDFNGIITFEADSTVDLNSLLEMIILHNLKYDLILASPYAYSGNLNGTNFLRKILSKFGNIFMRNSLDLDGINTLSSFMRLYDKKILYLIIQNKAKISNGFVSVIEILYFLSKI